MRNLKAYTIFEVLLSIGLVSVLFAISLPVAINFQYKNDLESAVNTSVRALRTAQTYSQSVNQNSNWGVLIASNSITLFKGTSYATRDTAQDLVYNFIGGTSISGMSEIVYSKFNGEPSSTGTLTLVNNSNSRQITINAKGTLNY